MSNGKKAEGKPDESRFEAVRKAMEDTGIDAASMLQWLDRKSRESKDAGIRSKVEALRGLEGKCFVEMAVPEGGMFPSMKRYYKVISARSENEYRVECLVFDEHPLYWFDYKSNMAGVPGDWFLGTFRFESIRTESVMSAEIAMMSEIGRDEFDAAMRRYIGELSVMRWVPDHFRLGGKLPSDPGWETESN